VDRLLILAHGRLVFQGGIEDLVDPGELSTVVDSPDRAALAAALDAAGLHHENLRYGMAVSDADATRVGAVAAGAGVALSLLQRRGPSLEEVFLELVSGERTHASAVPAATEGGAQ
jgi:ABC-2 type transport system ATP-binding protein